MRHLVGLLFVVLAPAPVFAERVYNEGHGETWDCAKDAEVTVNINSSNFTFKGACKRISLNGNRNTVTIASVKELVVNGNRNTATADSADALQANGNENKVTIKTGSPRIQNLGTDNAITTGKAKASDKAESKPADDGDARPAGASAIDCGKTPSYSITTGAGTYAFTGACEKISVAGGDNTLSIESVKSLNIAGSKNRVEVGAADRIATIGSENSVKYKKGISGAKPKISTVGTNNKIEQVK